MAHIRVDKKWGHEIVFHNEGYCSKLLVYTKRVASSKHYHEKKHETFVVLSGEFFIEWEMLDDPSCRGARKFHPGQCLILEPRTVHHVRCLVEGIIVEASSEDDPADCVRLVPSEG